MVAYTSDLLMKECNALENETNRSIASYLLTVYMQSVNFYEEDLIKCFSDYLETGCLKLNEYNLQF